MSQAYHRPVLSREVIQFLVTDPGGTYIDGTVGGASHAEQICSRLSGSGKLLCFDADADAIRQSANVLSQYADRVVMIHANVRTIGYQLKERGIGRIHGLLLDLGVSSFQLDEGTRGFSFRSNDALDMRMDRRQTITASNILNSSAESDLANLIFRYGEERNSRRIARGIIRARPIETTGSLAAIVASVVGARFLSKSLARVFQALRIAVNDELRSLEEALAVVVDLLDPGGRIVVISYHSLEDRIVKDFFRAESADRIPSGQKLLPDIARVPRLRILTKKPIEPAAEEVRENTRARSAKMRVAERV